MDTNGVKKFIQELIGQEDLICLGDIAEIRRPHRRQGTGKNLGAYEYPIDYSKLKEWALTDMQVQRYDIIIHNGLIKSVYMVDEEPSEPIYHKEKDVIIRTNGKIQPEYICLFLNSQTGQEMLSCFTRASIAPTLTARQIRELYIPKPTLSEKEYRKTFEIEHHYKMDMDAYNELIAKWHEEENQSIASIFNTECLDKVLEKKSELFSEMVRQDIEELRACFKAKAYKATLIMAGSILEAILIDWLNDMSGKNYFEEDFQPEDRKGYKEKATLKDYINAVKYIEYPRWMDGAEMAHDIRDKRNLVHAKLGIYSDDINEETCLMVIDYLERVIKTRQERMYFRYDKRKIENFRRL